MMDLVALFLELVTTMLILATKPFSLVRLSCILGVRSLCIVIQTWVELLRAAISFHISIIWTLVIWTTALISFPVRVFTALQNERLLRMHLHEQQIEIEKLVWNRKELQRRLQKAIRECRMMEAMLAELDDEHDEAIVKIELLESELEDMKAENLRLREVHGKVLWSFQSANDTVKTNYHDNDNGSHPQKSNFDGSSEVLHNDAWGDESKSRGKKESFTGRELKPSVPIHPVAVASTLCVNLDANEVLGQQALLQSLFSAVLSLLVGMIIWEAEDPCMPLVVALFTVVGISLKSVVQFFSTIKNKPASDAVALLSLNWFILGTLTYPTLPRVAYMLTPMALGVGRQAVS